MIHRPSPKSPQQSWKSRPSRPASVSSRFGLQPRCVGRCRVARAPSPASSDVGASVLAREVRCRRWQIEGSKALQVYSCPPKARLRWFRAWLRISSRHEKRIQLQAPGGVPDGRPNIARHSWGLRGPFRCEKHRSRGAPPFALFERWDATLRGAPRRRGISTDGRRKVPSNRGRAGLPGRRQLHQDSGFSPGSPLESSWLDEADTVTIRVLHIHFSSAPGLVHRPGVNSDTLRHQFRMQTIHVINDQVGHPSRNPIAGKRRHVQPDPIPRQSHVTGIRFRLIAAMREFPSEAQSVAIKVLRRSRVRHMQKRDRELEQVAPP